jgi:hypothetical protein
MSYNVKLKKVQFFLEYTATAIFRFINLQSQLLNPAVPGSNPASVSPVCQILDGLPSPWMVLHCRLSFEGRQRRIRKRALIHQYKIHI